VGNSNGGNEKTAQFRASCCVILTKSRRMRWAVHVKRTGRGDMHVEFQYGKLRERYRLKDVGVDCRILLKWKLKK